MFYILFQIIFNNMMISYKKWLRAALLLVLHNVNGNFEKKKKDYSGFEPVTFCVSSTI